MKGSVARTVAQLSQLVGGRVLRGESVLISGIASHKMAIKGDIAFVKNVKSFVEAEESAASCLLIPVTDTFGNSLRTEALIEVENPRLALALIGDVFHPRVRRDPFIHPTSVIAASADIAKTVFIGAHTCIGDEVRVGAGTEVRANVVIGDRVTIGRDSVLHPGVVLYDNVTLGDRVILHAGVCIGADGFGYERGDTGHHRVPHIGTVMIEDDVELGPYTCVDRGAFGRTRIGRGTKLDNLIHVGHNCDIGERVMIAAQTGISGSVVIEDDVVIGGQVGFGDHSHIEKGVVIGSKAGVLPNKTVRRLPKDNGKDQDIYWGIPIRSLKEFGILNAIFGRLPQMRKEIKELQKRLEQIEEKDRDS